MNTLLKGLKEEDNVALTANGAPAYKSTMNKLYDLFALGGAYRNRSDEDCVLLFKEAYEENPELALKCLFYLRDIRGGQGERRFFRVCYKWLADFDLAAAHRNLRNIPDYGRWDDLLALLDTKAKTAVIEVIKTQITEDLSAIKNGGANVSLCAKWLPSENSSSTKTKVLASRIRKELGMTSRQYRKTLSLLRKTIKLVETQMSENKWDEIEYNNLPSRAGFQYRKAFARHDYARYNNFMTDKTTKVNAGTLYPCDIVHKVLSNSNGSERYVLNKYWDNLTDYFNGASFNGIAVVDTSGSMTWSSHGNIQPLDVAISLGLYCAEKCAPTSPFYNHYISFSRIAKLVECRGNDFVDKVNRIYRNNICEDTNIYSVFDLILNTAIKNNVPAADMPKNVVIISDMQFNMATDYNESVQDSISKQMKQYKAHGYEIPHLIFWNVNAAYNANIPMRDENGITFVSGYSPVVFDMILKEKTGQDLMLDKLNSKRYAVIW